MNRIGLPTSNRPSASLTPISPTESPSPSATSATAGTTKPNLSTGAKAGIGVGVILTIFMLGFGAFFLGMTVRKKSKHTKDQESAPSGEKPELEGKAMYRHELTPEMDVRAAPMQEQRSPTEVNGVEGLDGLPGTKELEAQAAQPVAPQHVELQAEPRPLGTNGRDGARELHGESMQGGSPVLPISDTHQYDHPHLTQNP